MEACIVWFRSDLRLAENYALNAGLTTGSAVVPVYIMDEADQENQPAGKTAHGWLRRSLESLDVSLRNIGSRLIFRSGPPLESLLEVAGETGARAAVWNRRYDPYGVRQDAELEQAMRAQGLYTQIFNSALLLEPWEIKTSNGEPYKVFTPFHKALIGSYHHRAPMSAPKSLPNPDVWPHSVSIHKLFSNSGGNYASGIEDLWTPGESGAQSRLMWFVEHALNLYPERHDRVDLEGTSRLSPHLHFGEISPKQVWHTVMEAVEQDGSIENSALAYLRQLIWREFAYNHLYHYPYILEKPFREEFEAFPWVSDQPSLDAWRSGMTGYPMVDAGMRQLLNTGWMHNRARLITSSFLTKDLLIPWQEGARWFIERLVDADLANNTFGWQWTAGSGADAAPYFRVFNPVLQGEKFDPDGDYVRKWVPELAELPAEWIHKPWQAPEPVLDSAAIELGRDYPRPIIDHAFARQRALEAYKAGRR